MSREERRFKRDSKESRESDTYHAFNQRKPIVKLPYAVNDTFVNSLNLGNKRLQNSIPLVLSGEINDPYAAFELNDLLVKEMIKQDDNYLCEISINKSTQKSYCDFFDKLEDRVISLVKKDATENKYFQSNATHISRITEKTNEFRITMIIHLPTTVIEDINVNQFPQLVERSIDMIIQVRSLWIDENKNECKITYRVNNVRPSNQIIVYRFSNSRDNDSTIDEKINRSLENNKVIENKRGDRGDHKRNETKKKIIIDDDDSFDDLSVNLIDPFSSKAPKFNSESYFDDVKTKKRS